MNRLLAKSDDLIRMAARFQEVTLGENVCETIKRSLFADQKWVDCHKQVATIFSKLKHIGRNFYVGKSEIELLQELCRFKKRDIEDALNTTQAVAETISPRHLNPASSSPRRASVIIEARVTQQIERQQPRHPVTKDHRNESGA